MLFLLVVLLPLLAWSSSAFVLRPADPLVVSTRLQHQHSRRPPCPSSIFMSATTAAADTGFGKGAAVAPEVTRSVVQLPTGLAMEVLSAGPSTTAPSPGANPFESIIAGLFQSTAANKKKSPLVFLHGSFHSAWCWAEHFLPFFAAQGYQCYSISCRGTSGSPDPDPATKAVKIRTHAADLRAFLHTQFGKAQQRPIIIGHSFGGAVLMKMLEEDPSGVQGSVFLCSVPPSGNGPMTSRFLKRNFILALKIVLGFVAKKGAEWDWLARELFFDAALDSPTLQRYKANLKRDSVVGIDVKDFLAELPSLKADAATGKGTWAGAVPRRLVIGAEFDKLVDAEGVEEMADFADAGPALFLPLPHDVMLALEWRRAAQALLDWLGGV